ncbi:MAG: hypothetical protein ABL883_02700 [Terricaulis sp.]
MKHRPLLVWLGLGVACATCCAPLLLPLLVGAGAAGAGVFAGGRLLGLPIDAVACGAIFVAIAAGIGLWWARRRRVVSAKTCGCATACDAEKC